MMKPIFLKLNTRYMKSCAKLPVALLRGARNVLIAALVVGPVAGVASVETEPTAEVSALINITGKVVDQSGNPVEGASVLVKGTETGVRTDEHGVFQINLPEENMIIVVSHVAYKVQEVNVSGMTSVTVQMQPIDGLDEVVVTGYGSQRRADVVGSIATVSGEELMDIPAPSLA